MAWLKESGGFENCRTRLVDPCTIFRFSEAEFSRSTEGLAWSNLLGNELQQWLIKNWMRLYLMHDLCSM